MMQQCKALAPRRVCATSAALVCRRWKSHSSASLTDEALLQQVDAKLNEGHTGEKITVDAKNKTIKTSGGELPMSPLYDPAWIKSKRRQEKAPSGKVNGKFRIRFARNTYAHAIASPIRQCPVTKTHQPRYFLQEFDVVKHPETNEAWFAPSSDSYKNVINYNLRQELGPDAVPATGHPGDRSADQPADDAPPRLKAYATAQKSLLDNIGGSKSKARGSLIGHRQGMAMAAEAKAPVWRHDMGDLVLQTLRSVVTTSLIWRAKLPDHRLIYPCATWEEIKGLPRRASILWLPKNKEGTAKHRYATYEVKGDSEDRQMAVHNLYWLLGEEEVARLRAEAEVFRDNDILVFRTWAGQSTKQLHLLLWKLQGYMDSSAS